MNKCNLGMLYFRVSITVELRSLFCFWNGVIFVFLETILFLLTPECLREYRSPAAHQAIHDQDKRQRLSRETPRKSVRKS